MNQTPFEQSEHLHIGTVDSVSPDEIRVVLDADAPESVALNGGVVMPFPRVNRYLLIPADDGFMVGQIGQLTVERDAYPKRAAEVGRVELPVSKRKMLLNPLGTLRAESRNRFAFRRGADALPAIGAPVVLPSKKQLHAIVHSGENARVQIGTNPMADDAEVCVDPNRLFGRHLAVLGNTGSGKSCSVAGLIRWSLDAAEQARAPEKKSEHLNARFIVLDPNGEYSKAFQGGPMKPRIFRVDPGKDENALQVPLWFWNSEEWCAFMRASPGIQRPFLHKALHGLKAQSVDKEAADVDVPRKFKGEALAQYLNKLAQNTNSAYLKQNLEPLLIRIRTFLADRRANPIVESARGYRNAYLAEWLELYIGGGDSNISIIDLSLVPSEIAHIVTAVTARMIFEALQRRMKMGGDSLPTVLVMDEAHTFIKSYKEHTDYADAAKTCCQVFERIAREGRKFGLGLVVASQRPSELSPTVLSQCNTFLLHRISNDRDQDMVKRFVPDNLRGLLCELPSLPSQHAILLGWATELPQKVRMNDLAKGQRPHSDDPEFWKVWTGEQAADADWKSVADDWQGISPNSGEDDDIPF